MLTAIKSFVTQVFTQIFAEQPDSIPGHKPPTSRKYKLHEMAVGDTKYFTDPRVRTSISWMHKRSNWRFRAVTAGDGSVKVTRIA